MLLTPQRRRGVEYLDDAELEVGLAERSLRDVALSNALFGGARAVVADVIAELEREGVRSASVFDVGTGLGDIPMRLREQGARRSIRVATMGLEACEALARRAALPAFPTLCARVPPLPLRTGAADIVTCSQLLHHLDADAAAALLQEMDRVARRCVIVSDLRRSWGAAAGIWLVSFPLRFHRVSRHDGVVSVMRGFTSRELHDTVRAAVGVEPRVHRHALYRLTAAWTPAAHVS